MGNFRVQWPWDDWFRTNGDAGPAAPPDPPPPPPPKVRYLRLSRTVVREDQVAALVDVSRRDRPCLRVVLVGGAEFAVEDLDDQRILLDRFGRFAASDF